MNQFMQRYKELLREDFRELETVKPLKQSIRVNTIKIKNDYELISRLEKEGAKFSKIPFLPHGYYVESSKFSLGAAPEYLFGYYYIQEAASQLPALILNPTKEDKVLDMAAAPGGKLTQMAELMENKGVLIGMDKMKHRMPSLKNGIERLGISNSIIYNMEAADISKISTTFDKILLDAPCSGNFQIDKDWFSKRTIEQFRERSELQKEMLMAAASVLKDNGALVYSTCSLEPEENEFVAEWAIGQLGLKLERINPAEVGVGEPALTNIFGRAMDQEVTKCLRLWPHRSKTQAFFIAKFRKE